jgi:hypothetical protein
MSVTGSATGFTSQCMEPRKLCFHARKTNRRLNAASRLLGPEYWSLASCVNQRDRRARDVAGNFKQALCQRGWQRPPVRSGQRLPEGLHLGLAIEQVRVHRGWGYRHA